MNARPSQRFLWLACGFEAALGAAALLGGWLVGHWPLVGWTSLESDWSGHLGALLWGTLAVVPLLLGMLAIDRSRGGHFARLRQLVDHRLVPLFQGLSTGQLALISLAAGWGEELLFRGFLQSGLARWIGAPAGVWVGLLVASLLFGFCHWITPTYGILAAIVGAYLGGLLLLTDDLLAPLVAHALYDFGALMYLLRPMAPRREPQEDPDQQPLGSAGHLESEHSANGDAANGDAESRLL